MMKKFYWLLTLILCCLAANAQGQNRNIYIWDVTRSMIGQGTVDGKKTPNVYKDVEDYLIKDIQRIQNQNTEIIVVPFQERVLEDYIIKVGDATAESKKKIFSKIKEYGPLCMALPHSNTNISEPLRFVQRKYQKPDCNNKLVLLTDGKQNMNGGMSALADAVKNWSNSSENNELLIYVLTTENAVAPTTVLPGVHYVNPGEFKQQIVSIVLKPIRDVKFNIKDDKALTIPFICDSDVALPSGIEVRVKNLPGSPIQVDEKVIMKNNQIQIVPQYVYDELKQRLPEVSSAKLVLSIENNDDLLKQNKKVMLRPSETQWVLINKKERVLTITVVEE